MGWQDEALGLFIWGEDNGTHQLISQFLKEKKISSSPKRRYRSNRLLPSPTAGGASAPSRRLVLIVLIASTFPLTHFLTYLLL